MMAKYIDTEKLKLKLRRYLMPNVDDDGTVTEANATRYFLNLIDEMSTSDVVEVKHGYWIPIDIEQEFFGCIDEATIYKCSLCGRYEDKQEPYCNCGARMDGD